MKTQKEVSWVPLGKESPVSQSSAAINDGKTGPQPFGSSKVNTSRLTWPTHRGFQMLSPKIPFMSQYSNAINIQPFLIIRKCSDLQDLSHRKSTQHFIILSSDHKGQLSWNDRMLAFRINPRSKMAEQKPAPFIPTAGTLNFNSYLHTKKAPSQEPKIT